MKRVVWSVVGVVVLSLAHGCSRPTQRQNGQPSHEGHSPTRKAILEQTIAQLNEAADLYHTVKDRRTAQAADAKLQAVARRLRQTARESRRLGKPRRAEDAQLRQLYGEVLDKAVRRFKKEQLRAYNLPEAVPALEGSRREFRHMLAGEQAKP